jgi:presenilin-like A22 family membrane protease
MLFEIGNSNNERWLNDVTEPQPQPKPVEPQKAQDNFKFEVIYLLPILASMLFGLVCAYVLAPQQNALPPVTIFPENTPGAPVGNALYFVVLIAAAAFGFYLLLKRRSKRIIKGLIIMAMTTASLLLSVVYLYTLLANVSNADYIIVFISIVITVLFDLAIFRFGSVTRNVAVIGLGGALGVFFGFSIPLWSAVVILAFLAVYDVVAVYKGPVGKIAKSEGLDQLQGLSFSFKDIQMGLGDLVFYSMLTGVMSRAFLPNVWPVVASFLGILIGSIITFYLLEKKGLFPGLPFPILFGLTFGLLTALSLGLTFPMGIV